MYDVRQLLPSLFTIVVLGMLGFGLACESPAAALIGLSAVLVNAWLTARGRFKPISRWLANGIMLLSVAYTIWAFRQITAIIAIGQFLVLLQIIKVYERRSNRDLAQLLVLSLLLMVASSVNTASLLFGILLMVYLFLALYCCLLFHLKLESDKARSTFVLPEDKISPATLRQDQRFLPRSMRRISLLIGLTSTMAAVAVFIFFPRMATTGMIAPWRPSQTITGLSEQPSMRDTGSISENTQPVAYMKVWKDEQPILGTESFLLRASSHDIYNGPNTQQGGAWQWQRTPSSPFAMNISSGAIQTLSSAKPGPRYRQRIALLPTGVNAIPALAGVITFSPGRDIRIRYYPRDRSLRSTDPLTHRIDYEVVSTQTLEQIDADRRAIPPSTFWQPASSKTGAGRPPLRSYVDPEVASYARRQDVTGGLAQQRPAVDAPQPIDEQIAQRIASHLHDSFAYTMDLSDVQHVPGKDPVVSFLYTLRRGHCQFFAASMVLMLQSLHIEARMVSGFKVGPEDYNEIGGYYVIRQSHAHAWVEVRTPDGWKTFDPTTDRAAPAVPNVSLIERVRHLFNYLDFTWATAVVAYDQEERSNIIQGTSERFNSVVQQPREAAASLMKWWNRSRLGTELGSLVVVLIPIAILASMVLHIRDRVRLRRRAARIGIETLPSAEQQRLVRQLAFYDELIGLLEKHRVPRPRHLTPLEFSATLTFLPGEVYDSIRRLTRLYYRIRYGQANLNPVRQRRLRAVIARIGEILGPVAATKN